MTRRPIGFVACFLSIAVGFLRFGGVVDFGPVRSTEQTHQSILTTLDDSVIMSSSWLPRTSAVKSLKFLDAGPTAVGLAGRPAILPDRSRNGVADQWAANGRTIEPALATLCRLQV